MSSWSCNRPVRSYRLMNRGQRNKLVSTMRPGPESIPSYLNSVTISSQIARRASRCPCPRRDCTIVSRIERIEIAQTARARSVGIVLYSFASAVMDSSDSAPHEKATPAVENAATVESAHGVFEHGQVDVGLIPDSHDRLYSSSQRAQSSETQSFGSRERRDDPDLGRVQDVRSGYRSHSSGQERSRAGD